MLNIKLTIALFLVAIAIHQSAGLERMKRQIPNIPSDIPKPPLGFVRVKRQLPSLPGGLPPPPSIPGVPGLRRVVREVNPKMGIHEHHDGPEHMDHHNMGGEFIRNRRAAKGRGTGHLLTKTG